MERDWWWWRGGGGGAREGGGGNLKYNILFKVGEGLVGGGGGGGGAQRKGIGDGGRWGT